VSSSWAPERPTSRGRRGASLIRALRGLGAAKAVTEEERIVIARSWLDGDTSPRLLKI
jgi:hypothetical protein